MPKCRHRLACLFIFSLVIIGNRHLLPKLYDSRKQIYPFLHTRFRLPPFRLGIGTVSWVAIWFRSLRLILHTFKRRNKEYCSSLPIIVLSSVYHFLITLYTVRLWLCKEFWNMTTRSNVDYIFSIVQYKYYFQQYTEHAGRQSTRNYKLYTNNYARNIFQIIFW